MSLEKDEIQTLIFTGYGTLSASRYLLLKVVDDKEAKSAFRCIQELIAFGKPKGKLKQAAQLAFTPRGLKSLGVTEELMSKFPWTFRESMEGEHRRRMFGDEAENSPDQWYWSGDQCDALLMLYAENEEQLEQLENDGFARLGRAVEVVYKTAGTLLKEGKEHFGFRDGMSQPVYRGFGKASKDDPSAIATGELVLGYPDEAGEAFGIEVAPGFDLCKNGTYLVFRQLRQDVEEFWEYLKQTKHSESEAVGLAAKMMGRHPDGKPVGLVVEGEDGSEEPSFSKDKRGHACPIGAHIRRSNPRDVLFDDAALSEKTMRRHRILRRGRPYGYPDKEYKLPNGVSVEATKDNSPTESDERGLLFIALGSDLSRQFEMIQQTWLNNPKAGDLHDEVCPITAGRGIHADKRRFTVQESPLRMRYSQLPHFVQTRGSGYFLLVGKSALDRLTDLSG